MGAQRRSTRTQDVDERQISMMSGIQSRDRARRLPLVGLPTPSNENGPFSTDNVEHDDDDNTLSSDEDGLHALPSPARAGAASFFCIAFSA